MNERYEATYRLEEVIGRQNYALHVFGDHLAEREGYKEHQGMDAIYYYLVMRHNWLPATVRSMSKEDIRFCLEEDMSGWTLPADAIPPKG